MCYAIPILAERVAPRCTIAEGILFLVLNGSKVVSRIVAPLHGHTWVDLLSLLTDYKADLLVCGGINRETKQLVESKGVRIIDNVSCTADEVVAALENGTLCSGFGFAVRNSQSDRALTPINEAAPEPGFGEDHRSDLAADHNMIASIDCLACVDRICLRGETCSPDSVERPAEQSRDTRLMLESARDISTEQERTLCRLSELIYFCLEMKYQRLGVAFCLDLLEATDILVRVLRRFFEVHPICCKVGGKLITDPWAPPTQPRATTGLTEISCNPQGQAKILNEIGTDLNIMVGLCMGADCVFTKASTAPVSTLFVKDKSLANNPIGALYSDYYLKEVTRSTVGRL